MSKLYKYFSISLLFTVIGFIVGLFFIPVEVIYMANKIILFAVIALLLVSLFTKKKRKVPGWSFSMNWVYLFSFIEGIILFPTLTYYFQSLGMILFFEIVIGTLLIFAILAYISGKKKAGYYAGLGSGLFATLTIILIVSLVNLILRIDFLDTVISAVGIIVFNLYILYDINKFKAAYEAGYIRTKNDYSIYVLNIYLDFINLLLDILNIVDDIKN